MAIRAAGRSLFSRRPKTSGSCSLFHVYDEKTVIKVGSRGRDVCGLLRIEYFQRISNVLDYTLYPLCDVVGAMVQP